MNRIFVEYVLNNSTQLAITVSPADVLDVISDLTAGYIPYAMGQDILNRNFWEYSVDHRRIRITESHYKRGHFIISEHTKDN